MIEITKIFSEHWGEIVGKRNVTKIVKDSEAGHMANITIYNIYKDDGDGEYLFSTIYPHGHHIEFIQTDPKLELETDKLPF